ncbi:MAG: hypothetical protein U0822_20005 [Anaerolineae bacterium]
MPTSKSRSGDGSENTSPVPPDWALFQEAYFGMKRAGVSHDAASAKALSLALKRQRVDRPNYAFIGWRAELNARRRKDESECDPYGRNE